MKNLILGLFSFSAAAAAAAIPEVTNVKLTQDPQRLATVSYDLSEDAIVTFDVLTNGVSVGTASLLKASGDVFRKVAAGLSRTITWNPITDWPDFPQGVSRTAVTVEVKAWAPGNPPDYMVVDIAAENADVPRFYPTADMVPGGIGSSVYKLSKLLLCRVRAAGVEWFMGSPTTEHTRTASRERRHRVMLSRDYFLAVYPMTRKQWQILGGEAAAAGKEDHPLFIYKDYHSGFRPLTDARLATLRTRSGIASFDYPTEAQWEFACRAGTESALYNGKEVTDWSECPNVGEISWYSKNSGNTTHTVGGKPANAWGFYDMLGNSQEMCKDTYQADYGLDWSGEASKLYVDPLCTTASDYYVVRGGYYGGGTQYQRSANREPTYKYHGFRPACGIAQ